MKRFVSIVKFITKKNKRFSMFCTTRCILLTAIALSLIFLFGKCRKNDEENQDQNVSAIIFHSYNYNPLLINNDTLFYDFDDDGCNDLTVTKQIDTVGSNIHYSGTIYGLAGNIKFTCMSLNPESYMVDSGTVISNSNNLIWLNRLIYKGSAPYFPGSSTWAEGAFRPYFGFYVQNGNHLNYGWFHFNYLVIDEIGYNKTANLPVTVGQKN